MKSGIAPQGLLPTTLAGLRDLGRAAVLIGEPAGQGARDSTQTQDQETGLVLGESKKMGRTWIDSD